jgi:hypothetical protein
VRIKGKIEIFSPTVVRGWLAAFGKPEDKVRMELLLDGVQLATAMADQFRLDVAALGFGDGACQFEFKLPKPLTLPERERLRLRIVGTDLALELPRSAPVDEDPASLFPSAQSPVFIVGSPRSGTSVLTRALVAAGYHGFAEGNLLGLSQMIEEKVAWYFGANESAPIDTLLGNVRPAMLQDRLFKVFKDLLDELNPRTPWYDKTGNPETIFILPRLLAAWPQSRVIFARRRGIENIYSRTRKFAGRDFAYHCRDWAANMQAWRTTRGRLDPARITEVDQAEMLKAPEAVAARLAALLGLTGEEQAGIAHTFRTERPQESYPGSAERQMTLAETGWSPPQIAQFEALCGEEMHAFEYEFA